MEIEEIYKKYLNCDMVSTDTRNIGQDTMFFALRGPNFNANSFAAEALEKGALYAVVDEAAHALDERYLLVEDGLRALQDLARFHRRQLGIPIIGITGSNGKTTTKELIHAVLSRKYCCWATVGNLNNHIGVPLTVLSIGPEVEIAVVEMGANHLGDITLLCDIAQPSHGLITNIGRAHLGEFGGFENVIRAKSELYHYLIQQGGTVWIDSQNEILSNMGRRFEAPLYYPAKGDDYECEFLGADPFVRYRPEGGDPVCSRLIGQYNFKNIAAALCIAQHFGVPSSEANAAVAGYVPENNRSQILQKGSNTLIMDAYNANPSSMEAAIDNIAGMEAQRKVLILGDMNELGHESRAEHEKLGRLIFERGFQEVYLCGPLIHAALQGCPGAVYFEDREKLKEHLRTGDFQDCLVLLKASRSIGLETVVEVF